MEKGMKLSELTAEEDLSMGEYQTRAGVGPRRVCTLEVSRHYEQFVLTTCGPKLHIERFRLATYGLCGEVGEIGELVSRAIHPHLPVDQLIRRDLMAKEAGDALWYFVLMCIALHRDWRVLCMPAHLYRSFDPQEVKKADAMGGSIKMARQLMYLGAHMKMSIGAAAVAERLKKIEYHHTGTFEPGELHDHLAQYLQSFGVGLAQFLSLKDIGWDEVINANQAKVKERIENGTHPTVNTGQS